MGKKIVYTKITPLPSNVPRQLAIELLHSHEEIIKVNPLVTGVKAIDAPRDCPNDEFYSTWYEISEIITWGFGMKKKIAFKGCFHDQPWGMQSHVYAPMGVDMRNKYRIGGNQPGEPREPRELGIDTPIDGLYLREDVEIVCNIALAGFVKKETKETLGKMVDRFARKAELLDEGKLHAMWENGMLKTAKPTDNSIDDSGSSYGGSNSGGHGAISPPGSPSPTTASSTFPPNTKKFGNYHDVARSASQHRQSGYMSTYQQHGYNGPTIGYAQPGASNMPRINELHGSSSLYPQPLKPSGQVFRSELPGDTSFNTNSTGGTPSPQPSPQISDSKQPPQEYHYPQPQQIHPAARDSYTEDLQQQQHHQRHTSGGSNNNISEWQQSVASQPQHSPSRSSSHYSTTENYSRPLLNSTNSNSNTATAPDHQRFSQMSVQSTPPQTHARTASYNAPSVTVKCPVCGLFEGDEAAVSHHVSKAHFS